MTKQITRQALDSGEIVHTGWAYNGLDTMLIDGVRPEQSCDVSPWMYFDASGKFLGPDENGLEPTFASAAIEKLREFNHRVTKLGWELVDLPLPVGVETEVFLTEGGHITGCGKIYGVFDSPWHAFQHDADARAIATLGAGSLPPCLQELAVRNSERLGAAIQCQWEATEGTGNVVAASWQHACDWLASEITLEEQAAGAWGWIESPNDDEGRFYVGKENMD